MKDPRKTLKFIFRLSLVIIVFVPAVAYLILENFPANYTIRLFAYLAIGVVIAFLIRKFWKRSEEKELSDVIPVGYMFASTYAFIGLLLIVFGVHAYIKDSEIPPPWAILMISVFLIFSVLLFYYSNKSRRYDQK
jgi:membrane protein implicated in regulation of membrane protease activity